MKHSLGLFALCFFVGSVTFANDVKNVGFWENSGVRAVFRREQGHWVSRKVRAYNPTALRNLPASFANPTDWFVVVRGAIKGPLKTQAMDSYTDFKQEGLQRLVQAPEVGERESSGEFASFQETQGLRPLLVVDEKVGSTVAFEKESASATSVALAHKALVAAYSAQVQFYKDSGFQFADAAHPLQSSDWLPTQQLRSGPKELLAFQLKSTNGFPKCKAPGPSCRILDQQWVAIEKGKTQLLGDGAAFIEAAKLTSSPNFTYFFFIKHPDDAAYALVESNGNRAEFNWGAQ